MAAIPGWRVVEAWERGSGQPEPVRALTLLQLAEPDQTVEQLAKLAIRERDLRLLQLRESLAGATFEAAATCPYCDELLEAGFTSEQLRLPVGPAPEAPLEVSAGDYTVFVRLPNTADVIEASRAGSREKARTILARRCTLDVRSGPRGGAGPPDLPEPVVTAIETRLAEADPAGDLKIALRCPGCDHNWEVLFDITAFLWDEISSRAQRLLRETHLLASAYGWSEAEILALSDFRRRCYLEMLGEA
jgi:hypothetical protein